MFESLPEPQQRLWPKLEKVSRLGFVLYGGTAAALRFGHRESVDFDFFSSEEFNEANLTKLFPWLSECRKIQDAENTYSYVTDYNAKISFLGGFDFGRIGKPDMDEKTGIQIASAEDVFAMKLRAAHDRVALKDFIDIAEFIRRGYSLEDAMLGANTLVKGMLPPQFTIQVLMWYDDPEFSNFPKESRDIIAKACSGVNLQKVAENYLPLLSDKLFDKKLFQKFQQKNSAKPA